MKDSLLLAAAVLALSLGAAPARAADAAPTAYTPPSKDFVCDLPAGWTAFADSEPREMEAVHLLGPDDSGGTFRTGIDIRYYEKGSPGFVAYKTAIEGLRRSDGMTDRSSTPITAMRIGAGLARVFEISETRRLPIDRAFSLTEPLHRYYAIFPNGESYFVVSLTTTREVYLDYRDMFTQFLKTFRPLTFH